MPIMRYTVRGAAEEGQCPACGFPLYSGDTAYHNEEEGPYCSPSCAGGD